MSITNKPTSSITENDLLDLIANQVAEGKTIDYKFVLPGNSDDDKKELLADASSFANTSGGYLVFGMEESHGIPTRLLGISGIDPDKEKLRIENIIRDGIAPRIAGVSTQTIQLKNGAIAVVLHIPKSWSSPHMITFKGASRFFARNSAGKYQLDVQEIRQAFLFSESTIERIKNYRLDRLIQIGAGNTSVPVGDNAKLVLHCIPLSAFQSGFLIDLPTAGQNYQNFFGEYPFLSRYNLDGVLLFLNPPGESNTLEYFQIFRESHVEYVNGFILGSDMWGGPKTNKIPITDVERESVKATKSILDYQKFLGVEPPVIVTMSMLQVKGFVFGNPSNTRIDAAYNNRGIEREDLILPDILIDKHPNSIDEVGKELRPIFDSIWNAAGWPRSMNYDENGLWNPRKR